MDSVKEFMTCYNLPRDLRRGIEKHYQANYKDRILFDEEQILSELPFKMRSDVDAFIRTELLYEVPVFDLEVEKEALTELADRMQLDHFDRGEVVCRKGNQGHSLYIIQHGEIALYEQSDADDLHRVVDLMPTAFLDEGDNFAAYALLSTQEHLMTAVAVKDSSLYTLHQDDIFEVWNRYPKLQAALVSEAVKGDYVEEQILSIISQPRS